MARRKKSRRRSKKTQRRSGPGIDPRALQIIQRKFGGRRPDRANVFRTLLQEARRTLDRSEYELALQLAEHARQLVQSQDEREACDSLLAEIYFGRAVGHGGQLGLDDLELAVSLAPQETRYQIHLARALEQDGRIEEALEHYKAASESSQSPSAGYLWCVAALRAGRPLPVVDLTGAQQNTLNIVQQLLAGDPQSVQLTGPILDGSLLLWQALSHMLIDETAAPIEELKTVSETLNGTEAAGIVSYYLGVAALRAGELETAWQALTRAQAAGYTSPWLEENLSYLARAEAIRRADAGDWQAVIDAGEPILRQVDDQILAETVSLAHFHLGYDAAQAGEWTEAVRHWQQAELYASSRYLAQNLAVAREQLEDWQGAAEAWRDMVRRRPRKKDHPDYLDDSQVASLWRHAAECYRRADNPAEAIACLRNGLKYAPNDVEMRHELSQALMANEQFDAAENELNRILKQEPDNVEALVTLGRLYDLGWYPANRAIKVLQRALELDPSHQEAREALGAHYIRRGSRFMDWGLIDLAVEQYQLGLEQLPDYAPLYVRLGLAEISRRDDETALAYLLQAYELEPDRARTVGIVLHELLHLDAEEEVERLLPEVRQMPGVLPAFWVHQGERVLECDLDREWAGRFFEEALALVGKPWVPETQAEVLADIVSSLFKLDESTSELGRRYRRRIDEKVPRSGAKEYIAGLIAALEEQNWDKAERLLGKARHKARKAGEEGLIDMIEVAQQLIYAGPDSFYEILERVLG